MLGSLWEFVHQASNFLLGEGLVTKV